MVSDPKFIALDERRATSPLDKLAGQFQLNPDLRVREVNRSYDIATTIGANPETVAENSREGSTEYQTAAKNSVGDPLTTVFENSVTKQEDAESAAQVLEWTASKNNSMKSYSDFILESALTVGDPSYSPALSRLLVNQQIAVEVLEERFRGQNEKGFWGKAIDFTDRYIFRQIGIGTYEDITRRSERQGIELATAQATMSPEEYREFIEDYAEELSREGVFTDENFFAFAQGLEEATNGGFDPDAGLNQALAVFDVTGTLGTTLGAGKVLTRVGRLKGPEAAAEAAERLSRVTNKVDPELQSEVLPDWADISVENAVKPTQSRVDKILESNELIKDIQYLYSSGTFGKLASKEQIDLVTSEVANSIEQITSRPVARVNITDVTGLGDNVATFSFGKVKGGAPFSSLASANKQAKLYRDKGLANVEVVKVTNDGDFGYYVQVSERLDLTTTANQLDTEALGSAFTQTIGTVLGSTRSVEPERLMTLANMGESGISAIRKELTPYIEKLEPLGLDSKQAIDAVFRDLRDGPDSFTRDFYSDTEFAIKFRQHHPSGKAPTDKDIDAFYALKTIHDAAYILQANRITLNYVKKGYKSILLPSGTSNPAKIFEGQIPRTAGILDATSGRLIASSDIRPNTTVWRLDQEIEGIEYVVRPKDVRTVQYDDVFRYNAGGQRTNPDANYFVTLGEGTGRAILTTFTEAQARLASTQIDTIMRAVRESGTKLDDLTNQLDDVIQKNNDWNPSVENTQDFKELAKRKGWSFRENVSFKARGEQVQGTEKGLFDGLSMDDYVKSTMRRNDDVLLDFGGQETFNYSPVKTIINQFGNAASEYSFRAYNYNAKVSWLKKAGYSKALKDGGNVNLLFREAKVGNKTKTDRALLRQRSIIDRRDNIQGSVAQWFDSVGGDIAEFVFENSGVKIPRSSLTAQTLTDNMLNLGFRSAFGFLNISQFAMQASHTFAVAAISPVQGLKAAGMIIPLRLALASSKKGVFSRFAKATGMSEKDVDELMRYINTSGRDIVDQDAIEKGTGPGFGISWFEGKSQRPSVARKGLFQTSKIVRAADKVGLAPFTEGERLSRLTAMVTAFLEHKKKFPSVDIFSDEGRAWIARREQDLTLNMTTTARASWQTGLMKLPTQWLSYTMRTTEALILGKQFTKGERARLALFMAAQGGLAGVFMGGAADYFGEKLGVDPAGPGYAAMKYGFVDGILSYGLSGLTGEDIRTAFGTRLAPLAAFTDLYRKVSEEGTISALGGPSTEIVGGALGALMTSLGHVFHGNYQSAREDIERVLRTPSGVDNIWKAVGIANTGTYRSKTGSVLPMEFNDYDAALQAVGVTNFKVADFYNERTTAYRDQKSLTDFRKDVTSDFRRALELWDTDQERAKQLMNEVNARIESSGFSPHDQISLRRSLKADTQNDLIELTLKQIQKDNIYRAEVLESLGGN